MASDSTDSNCNNIIIKIGLDAEGLTNEQKGNVGKYIFTNLTGKKEIDVQLISKYNDEIEEYNKKAEQKLDYIVINDGSKDNTEIIIKEYIKDKKNFKLYTTENKGVSHARNYGIKKSKGDYILFIDGDDLVTTNYLSTIDKLVDTIKNFDLIQTQLYEFYNLKDISFTNEPIKSKKLTKAELAKAVGDLCSGLTRRDNIINPGPVCKIYKSSIIKDFSVFEDGIFNV